MQQQYNAHNGDEPVDDPNPTVMGNINNRHQSLSLNLIINEYQSFLSEQLTEDDMEVNGTQTNQINNNNNDSESFL